MNWGQIADTATGGLLSFGLSSYNRSQQEGAAKRAERRQIEGAKEMTDYQKSADYDMWRKTGPIGMMEQIKGAGMSPGVMMGKGGIGGGITGSGGGMPSMQQVPDANSATANQLNSMLSMSQIKLMDAQAEKATAEANKTAGADTGNVVADTNLKNTQIENLTQGIENQKAIAELTKAQTKMQNIQNVISDESMDDAIDRIHWETQSAMSNANNAFTEAYVNNATRNEKINIIKQEAIGAVIRNVMMKSQTSKAYSDIKVNEAEIKKISNEIQQKWTSITQAWTSLNQGQQNIDISEKQTLIKKFEAQIKAEYPSIMQVGGKTAEVVSAGIVDIITLKPLWGKDSYKEMKKQP